MSAFLRFVKTSFSNMSSCLKTETTDLLTCNCGVLRGVFETRCMGFSLG
jgi:hypothetical protein